MNWLFRRGTKQETSGGEVKPVTVLLDAVDRCYYEIYNYHKPEETEQLKGSLEESIGNLVSALRGNCKDGDVEEAISNLEQKCVDLQRFPENDVPRVTMTPIFTAALNQLRALTSKSS